MGQPASDFGLFAGVFIPIRFMAPLASVRTLLLPLASGGLFFPDSPKDVFGSGRFFDNGTCGWKGCRYYGDGRA